MIKYKYLRFLAATGWGCVAMIMVLCGLWMFTLLPIQNIIFLMIMAYLVVVGVILWFTEMPSERSNGKKKKQTRKPKTQTRKHANVQQMPVKHSVPIFTYDKEADKWIQS